MADRNIDVGITIRTNGGRQAASEINQVRDSVGGAGNAAQNANRQFASMGAALGSLSGIIASLGLAVFSRDLLRTVEQVQNMEIRLKGLTKSAQDYAQVQAYLSDVSARHHKSQLVLADSFSKLLTLEQSGLVTRKQSIELLEGMSNAASKTGASTEQLKQSMFGFSQAMGSGVVHMEELNQVTEPMPGLLNKMAESAGYSVGEFRNLVAEGRITSEVFGKVMVSAFASYQGAAESAADTLTAKYSDISNAWQELAAVLESPISDVVTPVLEGIAWVVKGLSQDFRELKQVKDAIFGKSVTGGAPDNGMQIDLTGRAKPPEQIDKTKESQAAIRKEIEATASVKKSSAAAHHSASKHIAAGMSEEQKAAEALERSYKNLDESLKKQLALSSIVGDDNQQAALEYDLEAGALKDLTEQKKLHLLQETQKIQHNELAKKENEAKIAQLEQLTDKYNQLTLSARDYFMTQLKGVNTADKPEIMAQYDKNAKLEAQNQAISDSRAALQGYIDDVNQAKTSMDGMAASATNVFDSATGGVSALTGAMDDLINKLNTNAVAYEKLATLKKAYETMPIRRDNADDLKAQYDARVAYEKGYQELQNKTTLDAIDGVRQMASATSAMFDENSNEAKAFNIIAIAGLAAKAATAMLTQGQGDPYTAFARIAAMGALVSGIVAAGGGGGFNFSGAGSASAPPKGTQATGSVLGDKGIQSESIDKTYELLKSIHAEEYAELRGINKGVVSLRDAITGTVTKLFQAGGLSIPAIDTSSQLSGIGKMIQTGSGIGKFDPISNFLLKGLFGTVSKSVVGSGIATNAFTPGGDVEGKQYATIATTKKSWFSTKTSYSAIISEMDKGTEEALTSVFKSMSETMFSLAGSLGKDIGKDIGKRVSSYIVPGMQIDLHGLSGEDAAKKLNGVISTALDDMSKAVFGDIIGQYQKLGEGMLETAVRIVSEVAVVRDALNQSGMKMAENAIAVSDALVQAAGGLEQFQQQFATFYDKFFSDTEKQNRLQTRLNDTFAEVYMLLPRTRDEYRKIMEQLNLNNPLDRERYSLMLSLADAADQYYSTLDSGASKAADIARARADQEIQIMKLLGDSAGALAKERKMELDAMDESLRGMQEVIYTLTDLQGTIQSTYDKASGMLINTFNHFLKLASEMVRYRESLKVGDLSAGSPESKYLSNKSDFENTVAIIKGGKGTTEKSESIYRSALENLQTVSQNFLSSSRDYNASGKDYAMDYKAVIKALTTGSNKSLNIASDAEKQLKALNDMVSGLDKIEIAIKGPGGMIDSVDLVRDAINGSGSVKTGGLNFAIGSVGQAINDLNSSKGISGAVGDVAVAVAGVQGAITALATTQAQQNAIIEAANAAAAEAERIRKENQAALDRQAAEAELAQKHTSYNRIYGSIDQNAMEWLARDNGISTQWAKGWSDWAVSMVGGFNENESLATLEKTMSLVQDFRQFLVASGQGKPWPHDGAWYAAEFKKLDGSHRGGLDFVPFDGYRAELHRGERVLTASEARSADNKEQEATQRLLMQVLDELRAANKQRGAVAVETLKKVDALVEKTDKQTRAVKRITA